jgi:hypothetical protein
LFRITIQVKNLKISKFTEEKMADNIQQLKFFRTNSLEKAKQEFNTLFAEKNSRLAIFATIFLVLITSGTTLAFYNQMPPELPLFYSRPWGEEQLVNKQIFSLIVFSNLILTIINIRLAGVFFKKIQILSQILVWTTSLIALLNAINIFKIFSLTVF